MKNYQWILAKLGIPEKAVKLYVDLLDHGRSSPSEIVARTGLHRPEVYRYIPFLADKWLVVTSKTGKRQFFTAWSPERIAELLSELEQNANYVISELNEKYIVMNQKPHVEYREGKKGVTAVFADIVSTLGDDETFYRVTSEVDVEKVNTYLPTNYRTVRDRKNCSVMSSCLQMLRKWNKKDSTVISSWYHQIRMISMITSSWLSMGTKSPI